MQVVQGLGACSGEPHAWGEHGGWGKLGGRHAPWFLCGMWQGSGGGKVGAKPGGKPVAKPVAKPVGNLAVNLDMCVFCDTVCKKPGGNLAVNLERDPRVVEIKIHIASWVLSGRSPRQVSARAGGRPRISANGALAKVGVVGLAAGGCDPPGPLRWLCARAPAPVRRTAA